MAALAPLVAKTEVTQVAEATAAAVTERAAAEKATVVAAMAMAVVEMAMAEASEMPAQSTRKSQSRARRGACCCLGE